MKNQKSKISRKVLSVVLAVMLAFGTVTTIGINPAMAKQQENNEAVNVSDSTFTREKAEQLKLQKDELLAPKARSNSLEDEESESANPIVHTKNGEAIEIKTAESGKTTCVDILQGGVTIFTDIDLLTQSILVEGVEEEVTDAYIFVDASNSQENTLNLLFENVNIATASVPALVISENSGVNLMLVEETTNSLQGADQTASLIAQPGINLDKSSKLTISGGGSFRSQAVTE